MRIFLDTSLLSDVRLSAAADEIARQHRLGDEFFLSVITHFQLMWGYHIAGKPPDKYEEFLRKTKIEIAALTKVDADEAANVKPSRNDLLDALIAACVKRYDASIWTTDKDFLKFLPKEKVRIF